MRFDSESEDEVTHDDRAVPLAHAPTELAGVVLLAHPRLIPRKLLEPGDDPPTGVIARTPSARPITRPRTRLPRPLRERATPPPVAFARGTATRRNEIDEDSPTARFELEIPTTRRGTFRTP